MTQTSRPVANTLKQIIEIDGANFGTLEEFYDHFTARADLLSWGKNLDAFNDVLRGGFGTPTPFKLRWHNHKESRKRLGYAETIRQLEIRISRCHPDNVPQIEQDLQKARAHEGPTVFDWLVEIIRDHGLEGSQAEDGVELELI